MSLTKAFETYERPGLVVNYKVAAVKIYKGAAVGANALGFIVPMAHGTASLKFVGTANETVDNTGGGSGDKSVNVTKSGSFVFKAAAGFTPVLADVGKEVYATSDWEVQTTNAGLTNSYKVGTVIAPETTSTGQPGYRVRIDNYSV